MRRTLGEILIQQKSITPEQLETALRYQVLYGGKIGTNLVEMGVLDLDALTQALAVQLNVPPALHKYFEQVTPTTVAMVSKQLAEKYTAVPLGIVSSKPRTLAVAFVDPFELKAIDEISFITGVRVKATVAPELRIIQYLEKFYGIVPKHRYTPDPKAARRAALDLSDIDANGKAATNRRMDVDVAGPASNDGPVIYSRVIDLASEPDVTGAAEPAPNRPAAPARPVPPGLAPAGTQAVPPGLAPAGRATPPGLQPSGAHAHAAPPGIAPRAAPPQQSAGAAAYPSAGAQPGAGAASYAPSAQNGAAYAQGAQNGAAYAQGVSNGAYAQGASAAVQSNGAAPHPGANGYAAQQGFTPGHEAQAGAGLAPPPESPPEVVLEVPDVTNALESSQPQSAPVETVGQEARNRPALSASAAAARIVNAQNREEVGDAWVDYLRSGFGCGLVLIVRDEMALGWRGFTPSAAQDVVESIAFPLTAPSMLRIAYERKAPYRGAPPAEGEMLQGRLWKLLRTPPPEEVLVAPVLLKDRAVLLIHAQPLVGSTMPDSAMAEIASLCATTTTTLARLIRSAKPKY